MAERNLQHISAGYPLLSCHELIEKGGYHKKLDQTLPKIGMKKGYLPEESSLQEECLRSVIEDRLDSLKEQRAAKNHDLMQAEWNPVKKRAYVTKWKGKAMQNIGEVMNGKTVLHPEEVLFLMEMSLLELHSYGSIQSIQEAYRLLLGDEMALEKFQVYSHLRRIGYIVVRHKKRWNDFSQDEHQRQEQNLLDSCSIDNEHCEQYSAETPKHKSEKEYYDDISKKDIDLRKSDSSQIEPNSEGVSCLWEGIDIPNIAGKKFIELKAPPSYLLPKHVCPQKQHYVIGINASKNEVEEYYNYNKYEYNDATESSYNRTDLSANNTYSSHLQTSDYYVDYSSNKTHASKDYQFQNICDHHHFNRTSVETNLPSMSREKNNLSCHQHEECREANRNCTIASSSDNCQHLFHRNSNKVDQFQNSDQNYCYSVHASECCPGISSQGDVNVSNVHPSASVSTVSLNYDNSGLRSYEANRSYRQDPNNSPSLERKFSNELNGESIRQEETSKRHTYKKKYVEKRKRFDKKYKNNRKKIKRSRSPENLSPFPRVSKLVKCWKEFKHEAELQSTAEYLMNGPAKVLWNNDITPLVAPSTHLTKESVFGALSVIKNVGESESHVPQPLYGKLDFDVYLPTTNYCSSDPGPPDHSIKVVRCKDPTPSLEYRGKVPVHYAVIDNGTVTFFSFSNVKLPSYV